MHHHSRWSQANWDIVSPFSCHGVWWQDPGLGSGFYYKLLRISGGTLSLPNCKNKRIRLSSVFPWVLVFWILLVKSMHLLKYLGGKKALGLVRIMWCKEPGNIWGFFLFWKNRAILLWSVTFFQVTDHGVEYYSCREFTQGFHGSIWEAFSVSRA